MWMKTRKEAVSPLSPPKSTLTSYKPLSKKIISVVLLQSCKTRMSYFYETVKNWLFSAQMVERLDLPCLQARVFGCVELLINSLAIPLRQNGFRKVASFSRKAKALPFP
jgi:hypothetical protein